MLLALGSGLALGGFVAAQVGPVSLLCVRTSARAGLRSGVAVGLGAALVDLLYALLGIAGAATLVHVEVIQLGLGFVGAIVLAVMGVRTLHSAWRVRLGGETTEEVAAPGAALRTGIVATASNPLTIVSWAAVFGAATTASLVSGPSQAVALLAGIGLGSAAWFIVLAVVSARVGSRLGPKALASVDFVAGLGLLAFAAALGARSLREA